MNPPLESTTQAKHVIFFSGGICSYLTARRIRNTIDRDETILLFCDTRMEDEDLYRFLHDATTRLDLPLHIIADGRTPWQVFRDQRMLGNHRIDPCSKILKRQLARRWITDHCNPLHTTLYLGLSWYEKHRLSKNAQAWYPWQTKYPMCDYPLLDHCEMLAAVQADGLRPPRLYQLGFEHNNCGGFCVKAGHAAMRHLLNTIPERYAYHEAQEKALQDRFGQLVTVLTDGTAHNRVPLSLEDFRKRCEANPIPKRNEEWAGCACMLDPDPDELQ